MHLNLMLLIIRNTCIFTDNMILQTFETWFHNLSIAHASQDFLILYTLRLFSFKCKMPFLA